MWTIVGALPKGEGYEFFITKKKDQRIKELSDPILKRREKTLKTSPNLSISLKIKLL